MHRTQHGTRGLPVYGNSLTDADEEELEDDSGTHPAARATVTEAAKSKALLKAAKSHYATAKHSPAVEFSNAIPVTDDDLAVILFKRSTTGYQLLGVTTDDDLVVRQNSLHLQTTTYLPKLFSCS